MWTADAVTGPVGFCPGVGGVLGRTRWITTYSPAVTSDAVADAPSFVYVVVDVSTNVWLCPFGSLTVRVEEVTAVTVPIAGCPWCRPR